MNVDYKIDMNRPVRGIRLHLRGKEDGGVRQIRDVWLSGVRERMVRDAEMQRTLTATMEQIREALSGVGPLVEQNLREIGSMATELGLAIAREVVGAAVEDGLLDPSETVLRCLRQIVQGGTESGLRIELSPEDLNSVIANLEASPELKDVVRDVEFVANPALDRACVEISTRRGRMVYDPSEVLDRICDEIRKGASA